MMVAVKKVKFTCYGILTKHFTPPYGFVLDDFPKSLPRVDLFTGAFPGVLG
jgi:hypothetical protein